MKSLKKTLVLLVVFSMILSTLVPVFAATDVDGLDCEDQVTRMEALGIIKGFEDGTFRPTETITRAQMAVIICKMTGVTDAIANANKNVDSKFSDVKAGEWYTGYVNIASNNGIITGFPDGTFRPNETLTLNQVLTLCVKALGRGGYVDKMGTWPANYIAEAARLNLLKDVKGASDANRGNVAVICWNTLRTPTWYVNDEKLDGEISLSARDQKTLLEINFEEYTHENSKEVGKLKEVKTTVKNTPARNTEIGDRQIVLDLNTASEDNSGDRIYDFNFKAKKDFKKAVQEEKTYTVESKGEVVAYVPEEVYSDIDSLRNKTVTVVFGEDNIVTLISVEDDTVEKEFLTKYVVADSEITVGGEKYDLADEYEVKVNDVVVEESEATYELADDDGKLANADAFNAIAVDKYTKEGTGYKKAENYTDANTVYYVVATPAVSFADPLEYALKKILGTSSLTKKAFDKKVEATLTIDEDEVTKIDLFVSGNYADFETVETVAKKIKNEKIETVAGNITWDEDDYESKDYPRVYIDGKKAEITDIEAGDVLTLLGVQTTLGEAKAIDVIYASRKTVEGEVTKIKNKTEIYVDGTSYMPSEAKAYLLKDNLKDLASSNLENNFNSLHGEEVVLHTNVLGEYVLVEGDLVGSDWQFAIVDHIYDVEEDDEDSDLYSQKLRLVTMDGSKVRNFKLVYDANNEYVAADEVISKKVKDGETTKYGYSLSEETGWTISEAPDKAKDGYALTGKVEEDKIIAFKANADGEIELDEVFKITDTIANINSDVKSDYDFVALAQNYGTSQGEKISYDTKRIDVTDNGTTTRYKVTSDTKIINVVDKETSTWKKFVDDTGSSAKTAAKSLIVMEADKNEIAYILILETDVATSDTQYAIVLDATYTTSRTETSALLLGIDGNEYVYKYDDSTDLVEGSLISYTVSDDKMRLVDMLVDLDEANEIKASTDSFTDSTLTEARKCAYKVEKVEEDYLVYTDEADVNLTSDRYLDINTDDITVIDYRTGEMVKAQYDAETLEGEYVLFFDTDTDEDGVELLVIIKE